MSKPYHCPNCKTNRTRFNLIHQNPEIVKLDQNTGDITAEYSADSADPFHIQFKGSPYRVQCGICGLLEEEMAFTSYAVYRKGGEETK